MMIMWIWLLYSYLAGVLQFQGFIQWGGGGGGGHAGISFPPPRMFLKMR